MNPEQAKQLGDYMKQARQDEQLSIAELGRDVGIHDANVGRLERGLIRSPAPDKLVAIAGRLGLPLADVFNLAGYVLPEELPSVTPYLRTRYSDLPDKAVKEIEDFAKQIAREHGVSLDGPKPGDDETP